MTEVMTYKMMIGNAILSIPYIEWIILAIAVYIIYRVITSREL